jgi:hypothetical protein
MALLAAAKCSPLAAVPSRKLTRRGKVSCAGLDPRRQISDALAVERMLGDADLLRLYLGEFGKGGRVV